MQFGTPAMRSEENRCLAQFGTCELATWIFVLFVMQTLVLKAPLTILASLQPGMNRWRCD
jgi:hypothetical protein